MNERIETLRTEGLAALESAATPEALEAVHAAWLGRSGRLQEVLRGIGSMPAAERGPAGREANDVKTALLACYERRKTDLVAAREASLDDAEWVDPTQPGPRRGGGTIHPVAQMRREIEDVCLALGFDVLDGPWVEDEAHNFERLNIPADHPARDMQDTCWLENGLLLRTHTSPVQVRAMLGEVARPAGRDAAPPFRVVVPGRVFRNEALDASHENTFHQVEGLCVDRGIHVGHLVHTLRALLAGIFRAPVEVRLRPSYFPFTEPSFELEMRCVVCGGGGCPVCKQSGWVELLGCGLVHPRVLAGCGVDPAVWSGFAFGLGIDRLLMMRYGIEDIRHLMGGDLRFLRQFPCGVEG